MSLFPFQSFAHQFPILVYADVIADMDLTTPGTTLKGAPGGVTWKDKSFLTRGIRTHGSSLTPGYKSGMSDGGALAESIYWNAAAPWVTIYPLNVAAEGGDNAVTNCYVKLSRIKAYYFSIAQQQWVRIGTPGNGLPYINLGKWSLDFTTPIAGGASRIYAKSDGLPAYLLWDGATQIMLHNPIIANTAFLTGGIDCGGIFVMLESQLCSPDNQAFTGGDGIPKYGLSVGCDYYPSTDSAYNTTVLAGRTYIQAAGAGKFKRIPVDRSRQMHYFITGVGANTYVDNTTPAYVNNGAAYMYQSSAALQANLPKLAFSQAFTLSYTDAAFYAQLKTSLTLTKGTGVATLARASTMWSFDNEDKLITVPPNAAAFGGARMVRNLLASPAILSTQSITTLATTYTISFYGTGSIAFSGTYAGASLAGTGVSDRVQRTFTATAGTLTLTVTGSVTTAQLEDVTGQADQTASEFVDADTIISNSVVSNDNLSITPWAGTAAVVTLNVYNNPINSALNAGKFIPSAASASHYINQAITFNVTSGGVRAVVYAYLDSVIDKVTIYPGGSSTFAHFNLTAITTTRESNVRSSEITPLGSGWFKLEAVWTAGDKLRIYASSGANGASVTAGDGVAGIGIYLPAAGAINDTQWFATHKNGLPILSSNLLGLAANPAAVTNTMLWCRDFTNAAWVKTNVTAAKTQIGIDKAANSCSLLTATAANGTALQTITAASAAACTGFYVKRSAGTGTIEITRDNGATWTNITSLINSSTFSVCKIENTSVTNPVVGFRISTSGDAIIVDAGLNHLGTQLALPVLTTTAAVTVSAQTLTYPTAGNFSDTAGTILATFRPTYDTWPAGSIVGKASFVLLASTANSGVQSSDGTNTASGLTGTPTGQVKLGCRWSGSALEAFSANTYLNVGAAASYDGSFNLTTIGINTGVAGYMRDVAIYV